ncbi:MAG: RNA pseudouridine synthase [Agarilytica sp.]
MKPLFVVVQETAKFIVINKSVGIGVHDEIIGDLAVNRALDVENNAATEADADSRADARAAEASDSDPSQSQVRSDGLITHVRKELDDQNLFPVHRLDKDTSGLMLIAKGREATKELSELFRLRKVEKFYIALTDKKGQKKQGSIKGGMIKGRRGSWMLTQSKENYSTTQFFSYGLSESRRVLLMKPLTGKTHQLRVAMKSNSAPILGDRRYGGSLSDRMYLHAFKLVFELGGEHFAIESLPLEGRYFLDEGFPSFIKSLGAPESLKWPKLPPPKS